MGFAMYRVSCAWHRWLYDRLASYRRRTSYGRAAGRMVEAGYFHVQKARPLGILFSVVGVVGLSATWVFATQWLARGVLTVLFAGCVVFGLPVAIGGGSYRSRFVNGHVAWEYPSRFYGRNDSCRISDVVEFQQVTKGWGEDSTVSYWFLLKDGTKKWIGQYCFGDRDAFVRTLQSENPSIQFVEKFKD